MKKTASAGRPRKYPAHFYRHRWNGGHLFMGACALLSVGSAAVLLAINIWYALAASAVALPIFLMLSVCVMEKQRAYVCVDREGVEIGSLYRVRRFDWRDIDDVWVTRMGGGSPCDALVIRPRHSVGGDPLIADHWDSPVVMIYEHIVRYRERYWNEASAPVSGM
jgi:hypothetical protein